MDIGKILISTAIKSAQKAKIDGVLGAAVRAIDVDRLEEEWEGFAPLGGDVIDVTPEVINVSNLDSRVNILISQAKRSALQMPVRQKAASITAHCRGDDKLCLVETIYNWVKGNIHYREEFQEQFVSPIFYAEGYDVADCDDYSMLIGSLLLASGVGIEEGTPLIFRVTGKSKKSPSHIFPLAPVAGDYIALDATLEQPIGYDLSEHGEIIVKDFYVY